MPMETQAPNTGRTTILETALAQLRQIVEDGLRHGFFECVVSGKTVNEKKRQLEIKSGKSYHFTIVEDELPRR